MQLFQPKHPKISGPYLCAVCEFKICYVVVFPIPKPKPRADKAIYFIYTFIFFEDFACVLSLLIWGPIKLRVQINVRDNLSLLHAWWFNISWLPQSSFTYLVLILRENSLQKGEVLCRTVLPYSPTRRHFCGWGESSTDMLRLQLHIYIFSLFKLCLQSFRRELTYRYFVNTKGNVDH